jgi:hypothetical protein
MMDLKELKSFYPIEQSEDLEIGTHHEIKINDTKYNVTVSELKLVIDKDYKGNYRKRILVTFGYFAYME